MIHTEAVKFAASGTQSFDGYVARPAEGRGPVLLVLSEMFGLNQPMRDLADGYAERGVAVVVPNVYWRSQHPQALGYDGADRQMAWERLAAFDFDAVGDDMKQVADWARRQPWCSGKVLALGFCAGGKMAYIAAARSGVDGAIGLYGLGVSNHLDEAGKISCPVELHYGLADEHVPLAEIDKVEAGTRANPHIEIVRFPGAAHSFFNPIRPGYHAQSAKAAGERIDAMLASMR